MNPSARTSAFAVTRWTLVAQAKGDDAGARNALSELCAAYYEPVVAFLRAEGRSDDVARDLAHGFFARVLAGKSLAGADSARGRFRSYLLGAVKHFLGNERASAAAEKRGGGAEPVPLERDESEENDGSVEIPAPPGVRADEAFERQWALTIIARALEIVGDEMRAAGKRAHFDTLKPWLVGSGADTPALSQLTVAQALGLSEGAVKVAIHRLRQRFRAAVKSEIAQTVPADADVDDELNHLVAVLVRG